MSERGGLVGEVYALHYSQRLLYKMSVIKRILKLQKLKGTFSEEE